MMDKETFAKSLLAMAATDLEASETLRERELYVQSLFFFQQSVEKANKALGVIADFLLPEESKLVGHSQAELFKKMVKVQLENSKILNDKRIEVQQIAAIIDKHSGNKHADYLKGLEDAKHIKSHISDFDVFAYTEQDLLADLEEIEGYPSITFELNPAILVAAEEKVIGGIISLFNDLKAVQPDLTLGQFETDLNNDPAFRKMMNTMIMIQLEILAIFIKTFMPLMYLGLMCEKLVRLRYPEADSDLDPLLAVTTKHPLVKCQSRLLHLTKNCISGIEEMISIATSTSLEPAPSEAERGHATLLHDFNQCWGFRQRCVCELSVKKSPHSCDLAIL
jgi:HEPN domain-containing protein